jgi:hypothetical protein
MRCPWELHNLTNEGRKLEVQVCLRETYKQQFLSLQEIELRTLLLTVGQLVEVLYYKLEGRSFDSRWGKCIFFFQFTWSSQPHYGS